MSIIASYTKCNRLNINDMLCISNRVFEVATRFESCEYVGVRFSLQHCHASRNFGVRALDLQASIQPKFNADAYRFYWCVLLSFSLHCTSKHFDAIQIHKAFMRVVLVNSSTFIKQIWYVYSFWYEYRKRLYLQNLHDSHVNTTLMGEKFQRKWCPQKQDDL